MTFDLWTHQFCLACDKQVLSEGAAYCSEPCRLSDFEKTPSTPSSEASSPGCTASSFSWEARTMPLPSRQPRSSFYLAPAYDFSKAQAHHGTSTSQRAATHDFSLSPSTRPTLPASSALRDLSPSSSHSSLCSIQSSSSAGNESSQLSDKARRELQAYAVSFDQARTQRRRSY